MKGCYFASYELLPTDRKLNFRVASYYLQVKNSFYELPVTFCELTCKWEHLKEAVSKRKILSIRKKSY